jgi:hypothetical protein
VPLEVTFGPAGAAPGTITAANVVWAPLTNDYITLAPDPADPLKATVSAKAVGGPVNVTAVVTLYAGTADEKTVTATTAVTVQNTQSTMPTSLAVTPVSGSSERIPQGSTATFVVAPAQPGTAIPDSAVIEWSSSSTANATVEAHATNNRQGVVTGVLARDAAVTITAAIQGTDISGTVDVNILPAGTVVVNISPAGPVNLLVGGTTQLNASTNPTQPDNTFDWTTSNPNVVSIPGSVTGGVLNITGSGVGTANIRATHRASGSYRDVVINVSGSGGGTYTPVPGRTSGVALTPSTLDLTVGGGATTTGRLTAEILTETDRTGASGDLSVLASRAPTNDSEVTWSSSNENAATVANGVVTARGVGTATIYAQVTTADGPRRAASAITVRQYTPGDTGPGGGHAPLPPATVLVAVPSGGAAVVSAATAAEQGRIFALGSTLAAARGSVSGIREMVSTAMGNTLSADDILSAISSGVAAGVTVEWSPNTPFNIVEATTTAPGRITGLIIITVGTNRSAILLDIEIPMLEEEPEAPPAPEPAPEPEPEPEPEPYDEDYDM